MLVFFLSRFISVKFVKCDWVTIKVVTHCVYMCVNLTNDWM